MTATTPLTPTIPRESFGAGRVLMLVLGSLLAILALAFLAGGGAGVWAQSQRDADGYFTTSAHTFKSAGYAVATDNLDIGTSGPEWLFDDHFAQVRITASGTNSSAPIFIGIGPTAEINRYLAGVPHDQIADIEADPFSASYQTVKGSSKPAAPGAQTFWRARATGAGSQTLTWPVESGQWSVLAMNADGSRSVSVEAKFGARVPSLRWLTIGLFAAAGVLILGSGALIYFALRRRPAS
jgi:hypothetical protein